MRPLEEQTILITGATDGLGKGIAMELARSGATLLLHGRDDARGQLAIHEVREQTGNDRLSFYRADFASLTDVRAMGEELVRDLTGLDALVNNAGVGSNLPGGGQRLTSHDGHELRFQVNYLASFLLTRQLVPLLIAAGPSRVVNVSSAGQTPIDFDDVMLEQDYTGFRAYCQSKLAQVMFTFDLAEELGGREVTVNCLHPASFMPTKIVLAARGGATSTLEEGVAATMRLIGDPALEGVTGRYYNGTQESRADPQAYDGDARRRLRELSEQLTQAA